LISGHRAAAASSAAATSSVSVIVSRGREVGIAKKV
jgi:hypothetical protein